MNSTIPQVSILIPAYNAGPYIAQAIRSVLDQTFIDWELVVLDDGSIDDTGNIARNLAASDKRIQVHTNTQNLGMLLAWNRGIELCKAPYFVKLDADDAWHPNMLEAAMEVLKNNPEVGLVFSRYININENGIEVVATDNPLPTFAQNKAFTCLDLVKQGPSLMLSYPILRQGLSVMRRKVFDQVGTYRFLLTTETQAATDTEFYFRVGAHFKIYCIDRVLYYYRVHSDSISATDRTDNLTQQKLYEIKVSILRYYANEKLIPIKDANNYLNEVSREYDYFQVSKFWKMGNRSKALSVLSKLTSTGPFHTLRFYSRRIMQKMFIR